MNNDNFFPAEDYKIPETSNYMKFNEGDNAFRVLSSAIIGYEYFNTDNKPIRSREMFETNPSDMKKDGKVKHFWAFVVYNYESKRIQLLELTQKSIMQTMQAYIKNPKWGNPKGYDYVVTKTGSGLDTEYTVSVNPKDELDPEVVAKYESMVINLESLYEGEDPFKS